MDTTTVTVKGQITIPKANREYMGLKPGDQVRVFNDPKGGLYLLKVRPISELRGTLKTKRHISIEEMNEAGPAGAAARYRRAVRK